MEVRFPSGTHQALLLKRKSLNPQRKKRRERRGGREEREMRKRAKGRSKAGGTLTSGSGINCREIKANACEACAFGRRPVPSEV